MKSTSALTRGGGGGVAGIEGGVDGLRFFFAYKSATTVNGTHQLHANQKVILMFNQKLKYLLRKYMISRSHSVNGMGKHSWLEDEGKIYSQLRMRVDTYLRLSSDWYPSSWRRRGVGRVHKGADTG
jgi:hypothetical protein